MWEVGNPRHKTRSALFTARLKPDEIIFLPLVNGGGLITSHQFSARAKSCRVGDPQSGMRALMDHTPSSIFPYSFRVRNMAAHTEGMCISVCMLYIGTPSMGVFANLLTMKERTVETAILGSLRVDMFKLQKHKSSG